MKWRCRYSTVFMLLRIGVLVDDLDDLMRAGVDEHGVIVDVSVPVAGHVVFAGDLVVGHAVLRQRCADLQFSFIPIFPRSFR